MRNPEAAFATRRRRRLRAHVGHHRATGGVPGSGHSASCRIARGSFQGGQTKCLTRRGKCSSNDVALNLAELRPESVSDDPQRGFASIVKIACEDFYRTHIKARTAAITRHTETKCMKRVLIIGASKGIGLETTRQGLQAGHHVRALARSASAMALSGPNLEKVRGDALKTQDVEAALIGVDVVIQTLGIGLGDLFRPVHLFSDATRVLIAAMGAQGVKRLICVTGFGAGDSRASISSLQRLPFQIVFGRAYEDKSLQERLIKESVLDWTIARPGVLTGGPPTGRYKILSETSQWRNGIIARADVAEFLVRQIEDQTFVRQTPVLVN